MKILQVTEYFGGAGLEQVVKNIVFAHKPEDEQQLVCVLERYGYLGEVALSKGYPVIQLNYKLLGKKTHQVVGELAGIVRRYRINALHAHNFTPFFFCSLASVSTGVPVIVTFHGFPQWTWKSRFFYNLLFWRAKIVVVNEAMKGSVSLLGRYFGNRIITIPNGIDLKRFTGRSGTSVRKELGIAPEDFVIGSVGRISPIKNHAMQIRMCSRVKDKIGSFKLLLVTGQSPDSSGVKNRLLMQARELGVEDNIIILDFREDIPDLLAAMDLFVLTSTTEGTSMALLEAMASGLPAVVSRVGGNSNIITHGTDGFLFDLKNDGEFESLVIELFKNKELRSRIGDAARKKAVHYSIGNMVSKYNELYQEICQGSTQ